VLRTYARERLIVVCVRHRIRAQNVDVMREFATELFELNRLRRSACRPQASGPFPAQGNAGMCFPGFVGGCTRTVEGGFSDSPDKAFRMYGRVYGALGKSFTDDTAKTVRISIVRSDPKETLIFRREFRVRGGGDVGWHCYWDTNSNLVVTIQGKPSVRLSLILDKQTGKFREVKATL